LFNIDLNDFKQLIKLLPATLEHLEIANNYFLTLPTSVFAKLMSMLPDHIHTLSIYESDVSNASKQQLIDNFSVLARQIKTLKISGGHFLGLKMTQLMLLLNQLPATVECLDFSDNQLCQVKIEELINLFSYLPVHVHRLKVSNNNLSCFNPDHFFYILQRLPYQIYELDLSQNGFDRLSFSKLNALMSCLPDGVINMGQDKITLRSDGKFVPYFSRPMDLIYRPVMKIRHQSCMSSYFLCMNQFMKQHQFDANIMLNIFSNLMDINEQKHGQLVQRMIHKAQYFKPQNKPTPENVVVAGSKNRLGLLARTELDWSYCGLGNLASVDSYKQLFRAIPPEVRRVNLRHNGFIIHSSNISCFSKALAFLPPHVEFLDISANHFELQSKQYLQSVFSNLPATVQFISFGQGRPVSLSQHLLRLDAPAYYLKLMAKEQTFMTKAKHLLDDYGQYGYWFLRLIYGYWNRKNLEEVTKCVFLLKHNFFKNTDDFFNHLENIPLSNESGALAKSIMVLFKENQNMMKNVKVESERPSI
jgi:Ran GTPase-activating protein (RanGAP) involved in mRNA processing and transport